MKQVSIARSLIGVPWTHQGRDISIGIDCVGLLIFAFEIDLEAETTTYGRHPHSGLIAERLEVHFGSPIIDDIKVGDVVLLGFGVNGVPRHVGIIGDYFHGGLSIIHTDSIVGKVVEHPFDEKWQRRVRAVYRHSGVIDE